MSVSPETTGRLERWLTGVIITGDESLAITPVADMFSPGHPGLEGTRQIVISRFIR